MKQIILSLIALSVVGLVVVFMYYDRHYETQPREMEEQPIREVEQVVPPVPPTPPRPETNQAPITVVGYLECLPIKPGVTETTLECAVGIAIDRSDGHMALDASLLNSAPLDIPMGSKVTATGMFTPHMELSTLEKYDIDGVLKVTSVTAVE